MEWSCKFYKGRRKALIFQHACVQYATYEKRSRRYWCSWKRKTVQNERDVWKGVFEKPFRYQKDLRWRLDSLQYISREEQARTACKDLENFETEHLFKFEASVRGFKTFLKYGGCKSAKNVYRHWLDLTQWWRTLLTHFLWLFRALSCLKDLCYNLMKTTKR